MGLLKQTRFTEDVKTVQFARQLNIGKFQKFNHQSCRSLPSAASCLWHKLWKLLKSKTTSQKQQGSDLGELISVRSDGRLRVQQQLYVIPHFIRNRHQNGFLQIAQLWKRVFEKWFMTLGILRSWSRVSGKLMFQWALLLGYAFSSRAKSTGEGGKCALKDQDQNNPLKQN